MLDLSQFDKNSGAIKRYARVAKMAPQRLSLTPMLSFNFSSLIGCLGQEH